MKKRIIYLSLVSISMVFASCGGNNNQNNVSEQNEEITETIEDNEVEAETTTQKPIQIDKTNKNPQYWRELYQCNYNPFTIIVGDQEKNYEFRDGGQLKDWVYSELNTDGWYYYNDLVISKDGKWSVADDAFFFSCSFTAEPYNGKTLPTEQQTDTLEGILYRVNSFLPLKLRGLKLNGNKTLQELNDKELAFTGIRNVFEEQETISFYVAGSQYIDIEPDAKSYIYAFPHELGITKLGVMTDDIKSKAVATSELSDIGVDGKDVADAEFTIPSENGSGVGQFDLVFVYNDIITGFIIVHTEPSK
ncbi:MAG: hypothetical protein MJ211_01435 [Bacteroidales bacterium]|nr:hypothetical protein [Bacteroidales bacterium]